MGDSDINGEEVVSGSAVVEASEAEDGDGNGGLEDGGNEVGEGEGSNVGGSAFDDAGGLIVVGSLVAVEVDSEASDVPDEEASRSSLVEELGDLEGVLTMVDDAAGGSATISLGLADSSWSFGSTGAMICTLGIGDTGAASVKLVVDAEYRHPTASFAKIKYFLLAGSSSMPMSIVASSRRNTIVVLFSKKELPQLRPTFSTPTKKTVS